MMRMNARAKFLIGGGLILATVGYLMASGIRETGAPDTFTDEADVVVEGRLQADGTFRATTLLAKCGSRFEAAPERAPAG